jgi:hypothetical protein
MAGSQPTEPEHLLASAIDNDGPPGSMRRRRLAVGEEIAHLFVLAIQPQRGKARAGGERGCRRQAQAGRADPLCIQKRTPGLGR